MTIFYPLASHLSISWTSIKQNVKKCVVCEMTELAYTGQGDGFQFPAIKSQNNQLNHGQTRKMWGLETVGEKMLRPALGTLNISTIYWSNMAQNLSAKNVGVYFELNQSSMELRVTFLEMRLKVQKMRVENINLSTPVASPWRAECQRTGRNSTRPTRPSSWYVLKWDCINCRDISRKSSTATKTNQDSYIMSDDNVKPMFLSVPRGLGYTCNALHITFLTKQLCSIYKPVSGTSKSNAEFLVWEKRKRLTTLNYIPKAQVARRSYTMYDKYYMINLWWFTWR